MPLRVEQQVELIERKVAKPFGNGAGLRHGWPQESIALTIAAGLGLKKSLQVGHTL